MQVLAQALRSNFGHVASEMGLASLPGAALQMALDRRHQAGMDMRDDKAHSREAAALEPAAGDMVGIAHRLGLGASDLERPLRVPLNVQDDECYYNALKKAEPGQPCCCR